MFLFRFYINYLVVKVIVKVDQNSLLKIFALFIDLCITIMTVSKSMHTGNDVAAQKPKKSKKDEK